MRYSISLWRSNEDFCVLLWIVCLVAYWQETPGTWIAECGRLWTLEVLFRSRDYFTGFIIFLFINWISGGLLLFIYLFLHQHSKIFSKSCGRLLCLAKKTNKQNLPVFKTFNNTPGLDHVRCTGILSNTSFFYSTVCSLRYIYISFFPVFVLNWNQCFFYSFLAIWWRYYQL